MKIEFFDTLESTSRTAAEAARSGATHLYTVVAARQTAGRGRLTRSFFSPRGGLYFSTVLRTELLPCEYGALTPFAAVAVHRALQRVCGVCAQIKWVNDLLLDGRKICGILAESGMDASGQPYVVLGIGVNTGDAAFPPELQEIAGNVTCADKHALLREILAELQHAQDAVRRADWLKEYKENSCILGQRVTLYEGEKIREGVALDVFSDGALLLRLTDGKTERINGGEISLRVTQNKKN